jgi:hypothetical protein
MKKVKVAEKLNGRNLWLCPDCLSTNSDYGIRETYCIKCREDFELIEEEIAKVKEVNKSKVIFNSGSYQWKCWNCNCLHTKYDIFSGEKVRCVECLEESKLIKFEEDKMKTDKKDKVNDIKIVRANKEKVYNWTCPGCNAARASSKCGKASCWYCGEKVKVKKQFKLTKKKIQKVGVPELTNFWEEECDGLPLEEQLISIGSEKNTWLFILFESILMKKKLLKYNIFVAELMLEIHNDLYKENPCISELVNLVELIKGGNMVERPFHNEILPPCNIYFISPVDEICILVYRSVLVISDIAEGLLASRLLPTVDKYYISDGYIKNKTIKHVLSII